jgi:uncharacterized damage-inducible protein DinB
MSPGISFSELLAWIAAETGRYEAWFAAQPAGVWAVPVGNGRIATITELLHHVYSVDLRLAQRVHGQPLATDAEVAAADPGALFALAGRGQAHLLLALTTGIDLAEVIAWQTQTGGHQIRASKRKVIAHSISHHLRHMAQAATLLRLHGYPTDWPHDLLLSDALL